MGLRSTGSKQTLNGLFYVDQEIPGISSRAVLVPPSWKLTDRLYLFIRTVSFQFDLARSTP
jgi:hypothetical protein